jgi:cupin 2 domain-containing protein
MEVHNIFTNLPQSIEAEVFESLIDQKKIRLERIISNGQATPEGEWYDQKQAEWVMLVSGSAGLKIEGRAAIIELKPGDHLLIPAHVRHRVEWTDNNEPSIWLALHFEE